MAYIHETSGGGGKRRRRRRRNATAAAGVCIVSAMRNTTKYKESIETGKGEGGCLSLGKRADVAVGNMGRESANKAGTAKIGGLRYFDLAWHNTPTQAFKTERRQWMGGGAAAGISRRRE